MTHPRVAIIGCGFSGVALALHLLRLGRAAPDIMLFERARRFGPGLAYGAADRSHRLNVRAASLSVFPDQPEHFARWLMRRAKTAATSFATRAQYGAYLEDTLRRSRSWLGSRLSLTRANIIECKRAGDRWTLTTADGRYFQASDVILAVGNQPPATPAALSDAPLVDPWDAKGLRQIPRGDVLLLGTGLTAVDVALSLARRRREGVIYALSRRGLMPQPHLDNPTPSAPGAMDLPAPLSEALFALRKEVEAALVRNEPWQHVIDRMRARTPELWRRLPLAAQQRFLRHLRPWWDSHRHRMAPEIASEVATLRREGRLRVLAGEIVSAEVRGRTVHVQHRQRGSLVRHHLEVSGVVNCTGAAMDISISGDPLLRQMTNDGLIRAHANGRGLDVDDDGRVFAADGGIQAQLYALGPITQGAFWESTAVPEIRVRAAALASLFAQA